MTEASHQMAANPLPPGVRKPGSVGRPSGVDIAILDAGGMLLERGDGRRGRDSGAGRVRRLREERRGHRAGFQRRVVSDGRPGDARCRRVLWPSRDARKRSSTEVARRSRRSRWRTCSSTMRRFRRQSSSASRTDSRRGGCCSRGTARRQDRDGARDQRVRRDRLADFKVPATIVTLDELPKGPTGKVQRVGVGRTARPRPPRGEEWVYHRGAPNAARDRARCALERPIRRRAVGIDDDFFALGGDSLAAVQLFAWIAENGYASEDLPLSTLLAAPTISALADVLERQSWQAPDGIVVVKQGEGPPLFYVAGLDGQIVKAGPLASRLDNGQPFYALVPPGEGNAPPEFTIEWLATFYLETIRGRPARTGRTTSSGAAWGPRVALEVARVLLADGDERPLSRTPRPGRRPSGAGASLLAPVQELPRQRYVMRALATFVAVRLRRLRDRTAGRETETPIERALVSASSRYVPAPYLGFATLFRTISYPTPASFWEPVVTGGLRVFEPVPTDPPEHFEMLAQQVDQALVDAKPRSSSKKPVPSSS